MKTNIRLFVPNTTEALDFEYGLVIHYMQNNEVKKGHKIGLQYYELSEIEPVNNALDIVEQKTITDITRNQSKIDGFTLDSHYALSFDQRFNNRIDADSVRQVWLWLHCKNSEDYPFLLERITDVEEKMLSQQNQLLVRLWAHPDWTAREIQPPAAHTVSNQAELISALKQSLSVHFDQIEKVNREKALAELNVKKIQTASVVTIDPELPFIEYKPKPIIQSDSGLIENLHDDTQKNPSLELRLLSVLEGYSVYNYYVKKNIPVEKLHNARGRFPIDPTDIVLALLDTTVFGSAKTGLAIGLKGVYLKSDWTPENFICWKELSFNKSMIKYDDLGFVSLKDGCILNLSLSDFKKDRMVDMLHKLIDVFDEHKSISSSDKEEDVPSEEYETPSKPEAPVYVAIKDATPATIEEPKISTWWVWPLIIFIGFLINPIAGGVLIALAICWYTLKFIFSSPILCLILVVIIIFGVLSAM